MIHLVRGSVLHTSTERAEKLKKENTFTVLGRIDVSKRILFWL